MPIYAFACDACEHQFDRLQKLSDPDPEICPECGAAAIRRQLTAPAFRLSGSGWYETDFKKDTDKRRNLAGDGGKPEGKASDDGAGGAKTPARTEAKPETKPETKPAATSKSAAAND